MTRSRLAFLLIVSTLSLAGCGESSRPFNVDVKVGPHGHPAIVLPDGAGFAEVLLEAPRGASGRAGQVAVAAYVFDASLKPLPSNVVSDVKVKVLFPNHTDKTATLAPDAKTPGRYASEPGPYSVEPLSGELSATVSGKPATMTFANDR